MARSWENVRFRRMMMQSALVGALGLAVALAWWVGHVHAAALRVPLGPAQTFRNRVLSLEVRPPSGWKLEPFSKDDDAATLEMVEQAAHYGPPRTVNILLEALAETSAPPTPKELIADDMSARGHGQASRFGFLGQAGILAQYPLEVIDAGMGKALKPILYACVVAPGKTPVAVKVRMVGPVAFAPADIELLKSVAASLQRVDPNHPAPDISVPVFKSRRPGPERSDPFPRSDNDDSD